MSDAFIQVPPDSTGKKVDTSELTVGANTVERQRFNISDPTTAAAIAGITNADPGSTDYGLTVRPLRPPGAAALLSGQQAVTASAVALASNACKKVRVKSLQANNIPIYVGPTGITTSTGYELGPGESIEVELSNTNLVFVIASTTGASVSWLAYA